MSDFDPDYLRQDAEDLLSAARIRLNVAEEVGDNNIKDLAEQIAAMFDRHDLDGAEQLARIGARVAEQLARIDRHEASLVGIGIALLHAAEQLERIGDQLERIARQPETAPTGSAHAVPRLPARDREST